jgi:hypothetical protein
MGQLRYTYKCFSRQHILSPIVGNPEVGNEIVAEQFLAQREVRK